MNNMPMDQSQLLDWINQVSFVAYDTALSLITFASSSIFF